MRFRSVGICASNIRDYLNQINEVENDYINESTLAHIGLISLKERKGKVGLLGHNSLYKLTLLKSRKTRKRRLNFHYCRKKLYFYHPTKIHSNDDNNINNDINNQNFIMYKQKNLLYDYFFIRLYFYIDRILIKIKYLQIRCK